MSDLSSEGDVVVLAGGLSHERDVSLRSGRRVAEALRGAGAHVVERDVDATLVPALRADPPSCVVPLLHGETGEDGAIREVLELLGIPYVGSRPDACPAWWSHWPRSWCWRSG
jgi:D-alanine-D-alanine ligase